MTQQGTVMQHYHPRQRVWDEPLDDEAAANRQTASLGGVAISLFLIVVGLFLVHQLHAKAEVEDCLLSGRTNCIAIVVPQVP
jgi:hypothetical protein